MKALRIAAYVTALGSVILVAGWLTLVAFFGFGGHDLDSYP